MRMLASLLLSSLALAGCNPAPTPDAVTPTPAPVVAVVAEPAPSESAAPVAPPASLETNAPGVTFTIAQTVGDCNPETPYRAKVAWTIADPGKAQIAIHAESPTSPAMAMHDAQVFDAETGDWVWPGMKFFLVHRPTGEVLGTVTAGPETCN